MSKNRALEILRGVSESTPQPQQKRPVDKRALEVLRINVPAQPTVRTSPPSAARRISDAFKPETLKKRLPKPQMSVERPSVLRKETERELSAVPDAPPAKKTASYRFLEKSAEVIKKAEGARDTVLQRWGDLWRDNEKLAVVADYLEEYKRETGNEHFGARALGIAGNLPAIGSGLVAGGADRKSVPLIGGYLAEGRERKYQEALDAIREGTASKEQREWATEIARSRAEMQHRSKDEAGFAVGASIAQSIPFMIEMAAAAYLTGGTAVAVPVTRAVAGARGATKLKLLASPSVRSKVLRELGSLLGKSMLSATVAVGGRVTQGARERMTDTPILNEQGVIAAVIDDGQEPSEALVNAASEAYVNYYSEKAGELLSVFSKPLRSIIAKNSLTSALIKANPSVPTGAWARFRELSAFNGFAGELFEERVADAMNGILYEMGLGDIKFEWPTGEQWADEIASIGLVSAGMSAFERADGKVENAKWNQRKDLAAGGGAPPPDQDVEVSDVSEAVQQKVDEASDRIRSGESVISVVADLAPEVGTEAAKAIAGEAAEQVVAELVDEPEAPTIVPEVVETPEGPTTPTEQEIAPEAVVEPTSTTPESGQEDQPEPVSESALAKARKKMEEIGEAALDSTVADVQADLLDRQDKLDESLQEVRDEIKKLTDKLSEDGLSQQERKELKAKLDEAQAKEVARQRELEDEFVAEAGELAERIRERARATNADLTDEQVQDIVDKTLDALTDPATLEGSPNVSIGGVVDAFAGSVSPAEKPATKGKPRKTSFISKELVGQMEQMDEADLLEMANKAYKIGDDAMRNDDAGAVGKWNIGNETRDIAHDIAREKGWDVGVVDGVLRRLTDEDKAEKPKKSKTQDDEGADQGGERDGDAGGSPDVAQVGDGEPGGTGGIADETGGDVGERGGGSGGAGTGPLDAELTNEQVDAILSEVVTVNAGGQVILSGTITDRHREAASKYKTGGVTKEGRGILDEYYTDSTIVEMVGDVLRIPNKATTIIEPSIGSGNFLHIAPFGSVVTGYEINPISAKVAKVLHPDANIFAHQFERVFMDERGNPTKKGSWPRVQYVLGNPPYGDHRGMFKGLGEEKGIGRYEEYFIKRGLDLLKDGGTLAMVVPSGFLRSASDATKRKISRLGYLSAAYRLPNGVFAGTDIGTDIVVFIRKDIANEQESIERADAISRDNYFIKNPTHILGTQSERKGRFGMEPHVTGTLEEASKRLADLLPTEIAEKIVEETGLPESSVENVAESVKEDGPELAEEVAEIEAEKEKERKKKEKEAKKAVEKKTSVTSKGKPVPLTELMGNTFTDAELDVWRATNSDGSIDLAKLPEPDKNLASYADGKWYPDLLYAAGDIYARLDQLEKDKETIGDEQYARQKAKLEAVLPPRETVQTMMVDPSSSFLSKVDLGDGEMLIPMFKEWIRGLPGQAFGKSSWWEVDGYINNSTVRGNDADMNQAIRERRKTAAVRLFKQYITEELSAPQKTALEDAFNKTFNATHTPDYAKVPLFSAIVPTLNGKQLALRGAQKRAIGRLVARGGGLIAHGVGLGKAQPLTSGVLTPNGWKTMGEIEVGDFVVSGDGKPTKVLGVFPQGERSVYTVTFSDGTSVECDENHLWKVQRSVKRSPGIEKWEVLETKKMIGSVKDGRGNKNYSIPMVEPVHFPKRKLLLSPYVMGVLLGDGSLSQASVSVSNPDEQLLWRLSEELPSDVSMKKASGCDYRISAKRVTMTGRGPTRNSVQNAIAHYGLSGKKSDSKFVPEDYLLSSISDRIDLLRGLMDTDGYVSKDGQAVQFYTTSDRMADGVASLVQSLGGLVRRAKKHAPKYTYKGEVRTGKDCNILTLSLPPEINPFFISRKAQRVVPKSKYKPTRYITSITFDRKDLTQCILVENPDHTYITDNFTVTHNTLDGIVAVHEAMHRGWAKKPLIVVPSNQNLSQWIKAAKEMLPNATLLNLGNLGKDYVADLSALKIDDGTITFVTYEGFTRMSYSDATYEGMAADFAYISDDLKKHKSKREGAKEGETIHEIVGKQKRKTRADVNFEDLGFDHLTVDEVHNMNKIVSKVKMGEGKTSEFRSSITPSDIGIKGWLAAKVIQSKNEGRNVNLLSATPFTNNVLEIYSIFSLIADADLKRMGLSKVNDFLTMFMDADTTLEVKADGSYSPKSDVRRFRNLRQYRQFRDDHIDFLEADDNIVRPDRVQQNYHIPQNDLGKSMEEQAQAMFKSKDDGAILKALNEMRKIAVSPYLSQFYTGAKPTYKEFVENSPKFRALVELIKQNKRDKPEAGGIVYFDDLGKDSLPLLREYLIKEVGFKSSEVDILSGDVTQNKRPAIQDAYNNGDVKILLGTSAISEGLNLQVNTTDIYMMTLPWNFTRLTQVIGRGWRHGNKWKNIRINNLYIADSVDVFMSQKLANKQKRYEAAFASNANELDVGDIDHMEMRLALIKDPRRKAEMELTEKQSILTKRKEELGAELAFVKKKTEKTSVLTERIADLKETVNSVKEEIKNQTDPAELEFLDARLSRYQGQLKTAENELEEHQAGMRERGIDETTLLERAAELRAEIESVDSEIAANAAGLAERVKEIAATMPEAIPYSDAVFEGFVADRAEQNQSFYVLREQEKVEDITPVVEEKPIMNAAGTKVIEKKRKATGVKRKPAATMTTEDTILADKTLSVAEKVDKLLETKQTGKEFKDVGARVGGSKKERAAIRKIMDADDVLLLDELIARVGLENVADVMDKNTILQDTPKPDPEKDKKNGVPSLVAYVKKDIYNRIPKVFTYQKERGKWQRSRQAIDWSHADDYRTSYLPSSSNAETTGVLTEVFKHYPDMLREFVMRLEAVKSLSDLKDFWVWYEETYNQRHAQPNVAEGEYVHRNSGRKFEMGDTHIFVGMGIMGFPVANYEMPWAGVTSEANPRHFFNMYELKKGKDREYADEQINSQRWWDKINARKDAGADIDRSHGNFKPLEHITRSEKAVDEKRVKAETLTGELGFKSVQFGNYMDDANAKEHVRHTIGAVEDISKALGIDMPTLIKDLGLSIAYGARGGGGFAVAHYEPDQNIINITKGRGDGSFFHEFAHFLDFTFGKRDRMRKDRWSSKGGRYYSGVSNTELSSNRLMDLLTGRYYRTVKTFKPRQTDDGVIDDVRELYEKGVSFEDAVAKGEVYPYSKVPFYQSVADMYRKEVTKEVAVWNTDTEYLKGSKDMGGDYWTRPEELLARAAQAYIEDKMEEKGMKNDYVTRSTKDHKAYPQGEERKEINKAFDELFGAVRGMYPIKKDAPQFKTVVARGASLAMSPLRKKALFAGAITGVITDGWPSYILPDNTRLLDLEGDIDEIAAALGVKRKNKDEIVDIITSSPQALMAAGIDGVQYDEKNPITGSTDIRVIVFNRAVADEAKRQVRQRRRSLVGEKYHLSVLEDFQQRFNIMFPVVFVDSILQRTKDIDWRDIKNVAEGYYVNGTIVIKRISDRLTAWHELSHLVIANMDKMPEFKAEGITRDALYAAQAEQSGMAVEGNERKLDEDISKGFEKYIAGRSRPRGILRRFFEVLARLYRKFARIIGLSKGDIIGDYYDMLYEGQSVEREMVRLENTGDIGTMLDNGSIEVDMEGLAQFKKSGEDGRLAKLMDQYNNLTEQQKKAVEALEQWNADLQSKLVEAERDAAVVRDTPEDIKELARHKKRKSEELTDAGIAEATLFDDPAAATEEVMAYVKGKLQLIETRNRLRQIRKDISAMKKQGKVNAAQLRITQRRLKLRERVLARNEHYINIGVNRGKEETLKMQRRRMATVRAIRDSIGLSNEKMKALIDSKQFVVMAEDDFNKYVTKLAREAAEEKRVGLMRQDAYAIIRDKDLRNTNALAAALGLPAVRDMDAEQVQRFTSALIRAEHGDTFLSQRLIETLHRTDFGQMLTLSEALTAVERKTGITPGSLANVGRETVPGKFTSWLSLARRHPFYNWLVNERFLSEVRAEAEYAPIERRISDLTKAARRSRGWSITRMIVPTDDVVFGYMEAENKEEYAKENGMTPEELALADYLITLYAGAYQYLVEQGQIGDGIENYITHLRRSFLEAAKDGGLGTALSEFWKDRENDEATFDIMDTQTGKVVPFEKWFAFAMKRTGALVPTKNVARASMAYFRAFTKKRATDRFIPTALLALKLVDAATGTTEKGLPLKPGISEFVKQWLNDARGRKIDWGGVRQGSGLEWTIKLLTTAVAWKWLGFSLGVGVGSVVGDLIVTSMSLGLKDHWRGIIRSFNLKQNWKVNRNLESFIGRNPLWEALFNPANDLPARIKELAFLLFSMGSYFNTQFYVRAKMTPQEYRDAMASDESMRQMARDLSKWKVSKFHIPTLAGSTAAAKMVTQFRGWAMPILNTAISAVADIKRVYQRGDTRTSQEIAVDTGKLLTYAFVGYMLASMLGGDDDEKRPDDIRGQLAWYARRELKTVMAAMWSVTGYVQGVFPVASALNDILNTLILAFTQEEYERDGEGYVKGDKKWQLSAYRAVTPRALRDHMDDDLLRDRDLFTEMLDEAVKTGQFDAEKIAEMEFGDREAWNQPDEKKREEYRKDMIGEVRVRYTVMVKYPHSKVAEIILRTSGGTGANKHMTNTDKVNAMLMLANDVGIEEVRNELYAMLQDPDLYANLAKKKGGFVSKNLWKEFEKARTQYEAAP